MGDVSGLSSCGTLLEIPLTDLLNNADFGHVFVRDKAKYSCSVCNGLWPSTDEIIPKYHSCSHCGLSAHTNCRILAKTCVDCTPDLDISEILEYNSDTHLNATKGTFYISLLQAYDLHLAPGTSIYGKIQLYATGHSLTTGVTTTGNNECTWETSTEGLTLESAANNDAFPVNAPLICVENSLQGLTKDDFVFSIEIWTSFMGFFDSLVAKAEISLLPALLYPHKKLERWFGVQNANQAVVKPSSGHHDMDELLSANGKVLLRITYRPEVNYKLTRRTVSNPVTPSSAAAASTESTVSSADSNDASSGGDYTPKSTTDSDTTDELNVPHSGASTAVAGAGLILRTASEDDQKFGTPPKGNTPNVHPKSPFFQQEEETTETQQQHQKNKINIEKKQPEPAQREVLHVSNKVPFSGVKSLTSASPNGLFVDIPEVAPIPAPVPPLAAVAEAVAVKAALTDSEAAAQGGALLQTLLDFSEQTTNVIGNFLFEMEGLQQEKPREEKQPTETAVALERKDSKLAGLKPSPKVENVNGSTSIGVTGSNNANATIVPTATAAGVLSHVGVMQVHLVAAVKSKVKDPADGDHYVTVSLEDTTQEWRTNSVYSSASPVFNANFTIPMPHYRSAILLNLMDAHTKRRIGFTRFSVYQIIHRDAERTTVNSDLKSNHKAGTTAAENVPIRDVADKEDIGYFSVGVRFEEALDQMILCASPKYAQECAPEEMSVEKLGVHVARFTAIIDLFGSIYGEYLYIMDWKDPLLTGVLFALFLYYTLRVSAEYALSGVALGLLILMTRMLYRRKTGIYKEYYTKKGLIEKKKKKGGDEYRPVAVLKTSVLAYRNLPAGTVRPSVKVTYHPMIELDENQQQQQLQQAASASGGSGGASTTSAGEKSDVGQKEHIVGYFNAGSNCLGCSSMGSTVTLSNMVGLESPAPSKELMLQNINHPWPLKDETLISSGSEVQRSECADIALVYPILQPIAAKVKPLAHLSLRSPTPTVSESHSVSSAAAEKEGTSSTEQFLPWDKCEGFLRFSFRYENTKSSRRFNMIADTIPDDWIEVPIKDLVQSTTYGNTSGGELVRWYRVNNMEDQESHAEDVHRFNEVDTMLFHPISTARASKRSARGTPEKSVRIDESSVHSSVGSVNSTSKASIQSHLLVDDPSIQVLLRFQLELPSKQSTLFPSVEEQSMSLCLSKILTNTAPKESSGAISVLWHARDHVKYVQNLMAWILDNIESFKNIWNWTVPSKTFPIYVSLIVMWILTLLIPGRFLILLVGLYEFLFIILPIPDGNEIGIRFYNLLQSIPNDYDLELLYSKERKQYQEAELVRRRDVAKQCHINLPLKSLWKGNVHIKIASSSTSHSASGSGSSEWTEVFLLLQQGGRLVWWRSEDVLVMDAGGAKEAPIGQLLLCGHCGVSGASPVEVKQFGDGSKLMMSVFGKDALGSQQKLSIRCKEVTERQTLYQLIHDLTTE